MTESTRLRSLLQERHLHNFAAFCREYDRVAGAIDPALVGRHPSRAQFFRWLSGELLGTPYPHHCRVLEAMLPGHSAAELFSRSHPAQRNAGSHTSDVAAAYATRAEFAARWPLHELLDSAVDVVVVGISLNAVAQQLSAAHLRNLLHGGMRLRCAFLDPDSAATAVREQEEGRPPGLLANLTRTNIAAPRRMTDKVNGDDAGRIELRVYDEAPRMNLLVIDRTTCVLQHYLPDARGIDSPTLLLAAGPAGLVEAYADQAEAIWARGTSA